MSEHMGGGLNPRRYNPEQILNAVEAGEESFEDRILNIKADIVANLIKSDNRLVTDLNTAGLPIDERSCDEIGKRRGLGAEHVAAVSKELARRAKRSPTMH